MPNATPVTLVAIGPFAWGTGATVTEAIKNCKRNLSRTYAGDRALLAIYAVSGFIRVSDVDGSIVYDGERGCAVLVDEREVAVPA